MVVCSRAPPAREGYHLATFCRTVLVAEPSHEEVSNTWGELELERMTGLLTSAPFFFDELIENGDTLARECGPEGAPAGRTAAGAPAMLAVVGLRLRGARSLNRPATRRTNG